MENLHKASDTRELILSRTEGYKSRDEIVLALREGLIGGASCFDVKGAGYNGAKFTLSFARSPEEILLEWEEAHRRNARPGDIPLMPKSHEDVTKAIQSEYIRTPSLDELPISDFLEIGGGLGKDLMRDKGKINAEFVKNPYAVDMLIHLTEPIYYHVFDGRVKRLSNGTGSFQTVDTYQQLMPEQNNRTFPVLCIDFQKVAHEDLMELDDYVKIGIFARGGRERPASLSDYFKAVKGLFDPLKPKYVSYRALMERMGDRC